MTVSSSSLGQGKSLTYPRPCCVSPIISPTPRPCCSVSPITFPFQVGPVGFWSSMMTAGHSTSEGRCSVAQPIWVLAPTPHLGIWHQSEHFLWAVISVPLFCWPRASSCVFWSSDMSSRGNLSQQRVLVF